MGRKSDPLNETCYALIENDDDVMSLPDIFNPTRIRLNFFQRWNVFLPNLETNSRSINLLNVTFIQNYHARENGFKLTNVVFLSWSLFIGPSLLRVLLYLPNSDVRDWLLLKKLLIGWWCLGAIPVWAMIVLEQQHSTRLAIKRSWVRLPPGEGFFLHLDSLFSILPSP